MKKTPLKTIVEWIQIREKDKTKQRNYQDKKNNFFVHQFATDTKHRTVKYVMTLNTEL